MTPDPTITWDDVLKMCPQCGALRLTPASPSMVGRRICLDCGVVDAPRPTP